MLLVVGLAARGGSASAGEDPLPPVAQADVDKALEAAGKNRPAIEAFLKHYERPESAERIVASRWLVANMPGKGFVPFTLRDEKKQAIPFDPLSFKDFAAAQKELDALEKTHGKVDFVAEPVVPDLETLSTEFLVKHLDGAFAAWEGSPPSRRLTFQAFLDWVVPYRSSEEPATAWREVVAARYRERPKELPENADANAVYEWVKADVAKRVRFDERYYLHPTDQSLTDTDASHCGRCEDITNMTVYAARALGLAVCTDYTPYWPHRDNNHAWPVLLDREGRGSSGEGRGAAKVYRKTFAIQKDSLPFHLPAGREAPNRYLANPCQVDVTDQYGPVSTIFLPIEPTQARVAAAAYLCVFNAGEWQAIAWAPIHGEVAAVTVANPPLYLAALHDGVIRPIAGDAPFSPSENASFSPESGTPTSLAISKTRGDAAVVRGAAYVLEQWGTDSWVPKGEAVAEAEPLRFTGLTTRTLYRLVRKTDSDKLERPFTIEDGKPRWW